MPPSSLLTEEQGERERVRDGEVFLFLYVGAQTRWEFVVCFVSFKFDAITDRPPFSFWGQTVNFWLSSSPRRCVCWLWVKGSSRPGDTLKKASSKESNHHLECPVSHLKSCILHHLLHKHTHTQLMPMPARSTNSIIFQYHSFRSIFWVSFFHFIVGSFAVMCWICSSLEKSIIKIYSSKIKREYHHPRPHVRFHKDLVICLKKKN